MARGFLAGLQRCMLFFRDSNGYATGQQSTLSNGATSPAYVADFPITAGYQPPASVNVDITGGDKIITTIQFGNAKTPPFDLALADFHTTLMTMVANSALYTTNTFRTVGSSNPNLTTPRIMGGAMQSRYTLDDGTTWYFTNVFPSLQLRYKFSQLAFQAKSDVVLSCTPLMASKDFNGRSFGSAGLNLELEGDLTDNYWIVSQHPIHITTFKADASAVTFNTVYKPISTIVTNNATPNEFVLAGTPTALSSITLAGVATLSAAGSAGTVGVLNYETDYIPV